MDNNIDTPPNNAKPFKCNYLWKNIIDNKIEEPVYNKDIFKPKCCILDLYTMDKLTNQIILGYYIQLYNIYNTIINGY